MPGTSRSGRLPKPSALKVLQGTDRPDRRRPEPQFALGLPEPPKHLDAVALRRYREVGAMLLKQGVMTEADMGILAMYAESWSNWIAASHEVRAERKLQKAIESAWDALPDMDDAQAALGRRLLKLERRALAESPSVKRQREEKLMLDRLGAQMGLSPSMRAKVQVAPQERAVDPMEALLAGSH